jgi:hypothetical protein
MTIDEINENGPKKVSYWIKELVPVYGNSVKAVFDMGKVLSKARDELRPLRHWLKFLKNDALPFGSRKVQSLIRINAHLGGVAQTSALPAGWSILSVLTQLTLANVERLIAERKIHPKLTLNEAKILTGKSTPKEARKVGAGEWARKVANQAAEHVSEWADNERELAAVELSALVQKLRHMSQKLPLEEGAVVGTAKTSAAKGSPITANGQEVKSFRSQFSLFSRNQVP